MSLCEICGDYTTLAVLWRDRNRQQCVCYLFVGDIVFGLNEISNDGTVIKVLTHSGVGWVHYTRLRVTR